MSERVIKFEGINTTKEKGMLLLSDPKLNNEDIMKLEKDFEYEGICGTDEGILYEDSLCQLFESSMINVFHEDDENNIIELEQFGNIYKFNTFIGKEGSSYDATHIDFRTGSIGAKIIIDDIVNNFGRIIAILEREFPEYEFTFEIAGDEYLTLHYKGDINDKNIDREIYEILETEFFDISYISLSSGYKVNNIEQDEVIICEIANIVGNLERSGEISIDGTKDMYDMFYDVYVPLYMEWRNNKVMNATEEETCYISKYAERRLIELYPVER